MTRKNKAGEVAATFIQEPGFVWFLGRPVLPIIVGVLIAMDGPGNIIVRSYAILACSAWVAVDLALWLRNRPWPFAWKAIAFCTVENLVLIGAMVSMHLLLEAKLEERQAETYKLLTAQVQMIGNKPNELTMTVTNNSSNTIVKYQLTCVPWVFAMAAGGGLRSEGGGILVKRSAEEELSPGGDAVSEYCVPPTIMKFESEIECADLSIRFTYELRNQEALQKTKEWRFVTKTVGSGVHWVSEPLNYKDTECRIKSQ